MKTQEEQLVFDFQDGKGPVPAHRHSNGDGWVADTAQVDVTAHVSGKAKATKPCIVIIGSRYVVTIADEHLIAGCECHTFAEWRGFNDRQIAEMDGRDALMFYPVLLKILDTFVGNKDD